MLVRNVEPMVAVDNDARRLSELLDPRDAPVVLGDASVRIHGLAADSRKATPGSLFFAVHGSRLDGARFIGDAVARGAVAVVVDGDVSAPPGVVVVRVRDCRQAKAHMASRFFGNPAARLRAVGVTGTNGKTTTTWMIRSIAAYAGDSALLLGTISNQLGNRVFPAVNTTPDAIELHAWLAAAVDAGASLAVMEVSSHALEQDRVLGIGFKAAVFTNLTLEHLDYHQTVEAYRDAKAKLFESLEPTATAVLNRDDPVSEDFARRTRAHVVRYGFAPEADVTIEVRRVDIDGVSFLLRTPQGAMDVHTRLVGRHNLFNAMAAAATCLALGYPLEAVRGGFELLKGVPGRMEPVDCGQDFRVLVDYAHTDDALRNALENLRPLTRGRLITVFGCGGDRDRAKRPRMGAVAGDLSDVAFLTSDNPRSEDPRAIIAEVSAGVKAGRDVRIEPDRRAAIEAALRLARGGDIVLIAGKGHEATQILHDGRIPFDDATVAREVLWNL